MAQEGSNAVEGGGATPPPGSPTHQVQPLPGGDPKKGNEAGGAGGKVDVNINVKSDKDKGDDKGKKEGEKTETKRIRLADDDDIPDDAEVLELSKAALEKRLARHTRRQLRDLFGTDDTTKIAKDLKELATLRAAAEEDRKAKLTKEQALQEERDQANARAEKAEQEAREMRDARDIGEVSGRYSELGKKFIAPKFFAKESVRDALFGELASELHTKTGGDATKITPKMVEDFWRDYAKENPEFGIRGEAEPIKIAVQSGSRNPGPPSTPTSGEGGPEKTARPGQANTMSKKEIKEKFGHSW